MKFLSHTLTTFVLCSTLVFESIAAPLSTANIWADRRQSTDHFNPKTLLSALSLAPKSLQLEKSISTNEITNGLPSVPETVGRWVSSHRASSPNALKVFLIQDIHRNHEAQKNISSVIQQLMNTGVSLLALEGDEGPINLSSLRDFPDPSLTVRASDFLLEKHIVTGAIHAGLVAPQEIRVVAVDDTELHAQNVEAFRQSFLKQATVGENLKLEINNLEARRSSELNESLYKLDETIRQYEAGIIRFGALIKELAEETHLPSASRHFLDVLNIETTLDFAQVKETQKQILLSLSRRMSQEDALELTRQAMALRQGKLSSHNFYQAFQSLCLKNKLDLSRWPLFQTYLHYADMAEDIDVDAILKETAELKETAYRDRANTTAETEFIQTLRHARLSNKLSMFELTPSEWRLYREWKNLRKEKLASFENFYRAADHRSHSIVTNLLIDAQKNGDQSAILVSGGFHTDDIRDALIKEGASVFVFSPSITKFGDGSGYLTEFARKKTPLEILFKGKRLFLAASPLSRSGRHQATMVQAALRLANRVAQSLLVGKIAVANPGYALDRTAVGADGTVQLQGRLNEQPVQDSVRVENDKPVALETTVPKKPSTGSTLTSFVWEWVLTFLFLPGAFLYARFSSDSITTFQASTKASEWVMRGFFVRTFIVPILESPILPGLFLYTFMVSNIIGAFFVGLLFVLISHLLPRPNEGIEQSMARGGLSIPASLHIFMVTILSYGFLRLLFSSGVALPGVIEIGTFMLPMVKAILPYSVSLAPEIVGILFIAFLVGVIRHAFYNAPVRRLQEIKKLEDYGRTDEEAVEAAMALTRRRFFGLLPPKSPTAAPFLEFLQRNNIPITFDGNTAGGSEIEGTGPNGEAYMVIRLDPGLREAPPENLVVVLAHEAFHVMTSNIYSEDFVDYEVMARSIQARVSFEVGAFGGLESFYFVGSVSGSVMMNWEIIWDYIWSGHKAFMRILNATQSNTYNTIQSAGSALDYEEVLADDAYRWASRTEIAFLLRAFIFWGLALTLAFILAGMSLSGSESTIVLGLRGLVMIANIAVFAPIMLTFFDYIVRYVLYLVTLPMEDNRIMRARVSTGQGRSDIVTLFTFYFTRLRVPFVGAYLAWLLSPNLVLVGAVTAVVFHYLLGQVLLIGRPSFPSYPDGFGRPPKKGPEPGKEGLTDAEKQAAQMLSALVAASRSQQPILTVAAFDALNLDIQSAFETRGTKAGPLDERELEAALLKELEKTIFERELSVDEIRFILLQLRSWELMNQASSELGQKDLIVLLDGSSQDEKRLRAAVQAAGESQKVTVLGDASLFKELDGPLSDLRVMAQSKNVEFYLQESPRPLVRSIEGRNRLDEFGFEAQLNALDQMGRLSNAILVAPDELGMDLLKAYDHPGTRLGLLSGIYLLNDLLKGTMLSLNSLSTLNARARLIQSQA